MNISLSLEISINVEDMMNFILFDGVFQVLTGYEEDVGPYFITDRRWVRLTSALIPSIRKFLCLSRRLFSLITVVSYISLKVALGFANVDFETTDYSTSIFNSSIRAAVLERIAGNKPFEGESSTITTSFPFTETIPLSVSLGGCNYFLNCLNLF